MKNFLLLLLLSLMVVSCKIDSKNNEEKENIDAILKEIEENKNNVVFLSFFPNMSYYTEEYLLKKELKTNSNLRTETSTVDDNFKDVIYSMPLLNSKFAVFFDQFSVTLTESLYKDGRFPIPVNNTKPSGNNNKNNNGIILRKKVSEMPSRKGIFGGQNPMTSTNNSNTKEYRKSPYRYYYKADNEAQEIESHIKQPYIISHTKRVDSLLNIYQQKYGTYSVRNNILKHYTLDGDDFFNPNGDQRKLERMLKEDCDYYVFSGDNKIIVIFENDYFKTYNDIDRKNRKKLTHTSSIEINYFTNESYKLMREEKIKDSIQYLKSKETKPNEEKEISKEERIKSFEEI